MAEAFKCDVQGCPILLEDKKGFEVQVSVFVIDRSDRDSDGTTRRGHACNAKGHLATILRGAEKDAEAFAARFTAEGKKKRR